MLADSGHAYIFDFEVLVAFYFVMFFLMTWTYGVCILPPLSLTSLSLHVIQVVSPNQHGKSL